MPRFGMGSLGQSAVIYVDSSGWSIEANGTITDNMGNVQWEASEVGLAGTYGPFLVSANGTISDPASGVAYWAPATVVAPSPTGIPNTVTTGSIPAAVGPAPATNAAAATFFNPPTGYAAATPVTPTPVSWWNQSTTLFGTVIKNTDLVALGAVSAVAVALMAKKKR
jgi:hypothetical protein